MQASRRKGSMSDKEPSSSGSAPPARSQTPSRQLPDRKSTASGKPTSSSARSSSAPKQRGKNGASAPTSGPERSSTGAAPAPAPPSPYDIALAKMAQASAGKSDDELERMLQRLLQTAQYRDAAYLIAASASLSARFKTSDVVRLMLDAKQFAATAQLIREMQLQTNQLLVTLFVKELVRSAQFHAAVRYATEFVQNFGKKDFGPRELERPSWTPQALIQAMVRASQFKTALKFAKQFALLEPFAPAPLVASMLDARQWDDAVASVMEFRLFRDFPIDTLVRTMLRERQWSLAVKCMGKVADKQQLAGFADALVRDAARAGDFIVALRYLREFKLDSDAAAHRAVQEALVDSMVTFSEMYKAIKYAIKFGLDAEREAAEADTPASRFATPHLIRHAIAIGQCHVATFYIKKLRLKDDFAAELVAIEETKRMRLQEFRDFVGFREAQVGHAATQQQLAALLGAGAASDADWVELEPVTREIVLSETVEVIPRRPKKSVEPEPVVAVGGVAASSDVHAAAVSRDTERQSRFNFARTSSADSTTAQSTALVASAGRIGNAGVHERASVPAPPPGLALFAPASGAAGAIGGSGARADESSSFNFAAFASAVQSSAVSTPVSAQLPTPGAAQQQLQGPPGMQSLHQSQGPPGMQSLHQSQGPPGMQSLHQSQGPPGMQSLHQSVQMPPSQHAGVFAHHGAAPSSHFGCAPVAPPPPTFAPSFHQSSGFLQNQTPPPPPSYMMPPSMAQQQQNSSGGGFPGMDIASLAMQFHSGGARGPLGAPMYGSSMVNNGGGMGYPSQMPPPPPQSASGAPPALNHLFPGFAPPPPPPQFAAPPRSAFKPSIGYTSVTTTRQKR